ncbi:MAG: hypothetical protein Q7R81_06710 [Candidatus Peregrinibacteria bacterium]|nr:hypothetical protein [Candidatus Peregrinibacteria bacterium]
MPDHLPSPESHLERQGIADDILKLLQTKQPGENWKPVTLGTITSVARGTSDNVTTPERMEVIGVNGTGDKHIVWGCNGPEDYTAKVVPAPDSEGARYKEVKMPRKVEISVIVGTIAYMLLFVLLREMGRERPMPDPVRKPSIKAPKVPRFVPENYDLSLKGMTAEEFQSECKMRGIGLEPGLIQLAGAEDGQGVIYPLPPRVRIVMKVKKQGTILIGKNIREETIDLIFEVKCNDEVLNFRVKPNGDVFQRFKIRDAVQIIIK